MNGRIEKAQRSQSGKTLSVYVDGKRFSTKIWEIETFVGQRITFDPEEQTLPDGAKIYWISSYTLDDQPSLDTLTRQRAQPQGEMPSNPSNTQGLLPSTPGGSASQGVNEPALRLASNVVAHAIAAGLITKTEDIDGWLRASYHSAVHIAEQEIPF